MSKRKRSDDGGQPGKRGRPIKEEEEDMDEPDQSQEPDFIDRTTMGVQSKLTWEELSS